MGQDMATRLAKLVVQYSAEVKTGETVVIQGSTESIPLMNLSVQLVAWQLRQTLFIRFRRKVCSPASIRYSSAGTPVKLVGRGRSSWLRIIQVFPFFGWGWE